MLSYALLVAQIVGMELVYEVVSPSISGMAMHFSEWRAALSLRSYVMQVEHNVASLSGICWSINSAHCSASVSKDAQAQLAPHKAAQGGVVSQAHRQQQQRECRQHPDQGRDAVSLRRGCHTRSGRVLQLLPVCGVLRRRRRRPWRRIITVCGRAGQHENGGAVSCRCDLLMRWRRAHSWGGRRLHISSGSAEAPLPQPATHT